MSAEFLLPPKRDPSDHLHQHLEPILPEIAKTPAYMKLCAQNLRGSVYSHMRKDAPHLPGEKAFKDAQ